MKSFIIAIMAASANAVAINDLCTVSAKDCVAGTSCGGAVVAGGNPPTNGMCIAEGLCNIKTGTSNMTCPNLVVAATAGAADGDYVKNKNGFRCDKVKEKSGCEPGHRCANTSMMGQDTNDKSSCVPEAKCGTTEDEFMGFTSTVECSSTVLAASMVTVIGVMTQM